MSSVGSLIGNDGEDRFIAGGLFEFLFQIDVGISQLFFKLRDLAFSIGFGRFVLRLLLTEQYCGTFDTFELFDEFLDVFFEML